MTWPLEAGFLCYRHGHMDLECGRTALPLKVPSVLTASAGLAVQAFAVIPSFSFQNGPLLRGLRSWSLGAVKAKTPTQAVGCWAESGLCAVEAGRPAPGAVSGLHKVACACVSPTVQTPTRTHLCHLSRGSSHL